MLLGAQQGLHRFDRMRDDGRHINGPSSELNTSLRDPGYIEQVIHDAGELSYLSFYGGHGGEPICRFLERR